MKKLTKKSLDELAKTMPVISENVQRSLIGGIDLPELVVTGYYPTWPPEDEDWLKEFYAKATGSYDDDDGSGGTDYLGYYGGGGGYRDDEGGGGGGGGGGGSDGNSSEKTMSQQEREAERQKNLNDGVNISSFIFESSGMIAFENQLKEILQSNSVIANLLSFFEGDKKKIVQMTFDVTSLPGTVGAMAQSYSQESYHITFNSNAMNQNGWNLRSTGRDNAGYDWSNVRNMNEALVATLAHEVMHANHFARYEAAMRLYKNERSLAARHLLNEGYSHEYVNIFFIQSGNLWFDRAVTDRDERLESYIGTYNSGVINKAIEEYRREHGAY